MIAHDLLQFIKRVGESDKMRGVSSIFQLYRSTNHRLYLSYDHTSTLKSRT